MVCMRAFFFFFSGAVGKEPEGLAGIRSLNIAMLRELQEAFWRARQSEAEETEEVLPTPLRDAL